MNILLFGEGKWGKVLKKNLLQYKIIKVFNSKSNIDDFTYKNIDWAVIATDNLSHFKVSKFLIKKKINIFCEKPLTLTFSESKELIDLANEKGCKLFVNHIYNFKKIEFKFYLENIIKRSKNSFKNTENIIFDLFYHDLYLILPYLDNHYEFLNIKILPGFLKFQIKSNKRYFNFEYDTNKEKKHTINNVNLIDNVNYIPIVFNKVFKNEIDLLKNNLQALKCNQIIDNFLKKLRLNS